MSSPKKHFLDTVENAAKNLYAETGVTVEEVKVTWMHRQGAEWDAKVEQVSIKNAR